VYFVHVCVCARLCVCVCVCVAMTYFRDRFLLEKLVIACPFWNVCFS